MNKYSSTVQGENLKSAQKNAQKLLGAEWKIPPPPRVRARAGLLCPSHSSAAEPEKLSTAIPSVTTGLGPLAYH